MGLSIYFFSFLLFFTQAPNVSWAYIPDYHMILSRTAENHGRGVYEMEQDVVFRTAQGEHYTVKETWRLDGEHSMRLDVEGRGTLQGQVQMSILYRARDKAYINSQGTLTTASLSPDFYMPFFLFRFSRNIKPRLVSAQIAPSESMNEDPVVSVGKKGEILYKPHSFLRLGRVGGSVAYAIGSPTPINSRSPLPGLWIEQDQFVVRKLRLPSSAVITAASYQLHPLRFWLAHNKTVSWEDQTVQIHVNHVNSLGRGNEHRTPLNPNALAQNKPLKLPNIQAIEDFYQRFR